MTLMLASGAANLVHSLKGVRQVGRYLLCDQIGSGGMAQIHLGRLLGPKGFSRTVAIKQLHPQFAQDPHFLAMFLDEARLAVRVRHGNVLSPLDIVATESELFIIMDYVNGESLASMLSKAAGPLPPPLAAAIIFQVLLGLHAAHEATREQGETLGLVHRDVSPQNILVGQDGVSRVLDFGIAKAVARSQITDGGIVKGKLGYMAPEQLQLGTVDRRTDIFTAGVVLWESLTGNGLFEGDALGVSAGLILHGEIAPPSRFNPAVTSELDAVVLKALARDQELRFQDALSMADALQRATALSTALEVTHWVEKLAGPELRRKAELVRRAEALDSDILHLLRPSTAESSTQLSAAPRRTIASEPRPVLAPPSVVHEGHRGATLVWPDSLGRSAPLFPDAVFPNQRAPTLSLAAPTTMHPIGSVLTIDSAGQVLGAEHAPPAQRAGSGRKWKATALALGIAAFGLAAALHLLSDSGGPRRILFGHEQPPVSVSAPEPIEPQAAPEPQRSTHYRPGESPAVAAVNSPPPAEPPPHHGVSAKGSRSEGTPRSVSGRQRNASKARGKHAVTAPDDHCNPPWIVGARQIKVFKPECVR